MQLVNDQLVVGRALKSIAVPRKIRVVDHGIADGVGDLPRVGIYPGQGVGARVEQVPVLVTDRGVRESRHTSSRSLRCP